MNRDIQTKANNDITKRAANPLGHIKSDSTFVFVTPREWAGADTWVLANQTGWKKLVVYTAVELEAWIVASRQTECFECRRLSVT